LQKIRALDILFDLKGSDNRATTLFCEWGQGFCCMAGIHRDTESVTHLKYFSFEHPAKNTTVDQLINEIENFPGSEKMVFAFAFPQQIFLPRKFIDNEFVPVVYETENVLNDHIPEWQLINQYSIPEKINLGIRQKFANAEFYHVHSATLKDFTGFDATEQLIVNIAPKDFRVVVKKTGKLQLAQVYNYEAPLDVVYYLLQIVSEFELNATDVLLVISGLVEEQSALYKELHQYFHNIRFAIHSELKFEHPHPPHFFSTIFNLNACVS
jgi:hypothetical protein